MNHLSVSFIAVSLSPKVFLAASTQIWRCYSRSPGLEHLGFDHKSQSKHSETDDCHPDSLEWKNMHSINSVHLLDIIKLEPSTRSSLVQEEMFWTRRHRSGIQGHPWWLLGLGDNLGTSWLSWPRFVCMLSRVACGSEVLGFPYPEDYSMKRRMKEEGNEMKIFRTCTICYFPPISTAISQP